MRRKLHIVLVEDDPDQEADLSSEVKAALGPDLIVEIQAITCEAEFMDHLEEWSIKMPDLFVIDLMLEWRQPWVESKRELPVPPPDMSVAGVRCLQAVRRFSPETPALIWTMTNRELHPSVFNDKTTFYLRKDRAVEGDLERVLRLLKLRS